MLHRSNHAHLRNFAVHDSADGAGAESWSESLEEANFAIDLDDVLCWGSTQGGNGTL